jgi:hypothetical protein
VVSRASLLRGGYFESGSLPEKILKIIFAPLAYTYALFEVRKRMTENIPNGILRYSNQKQLHLQENSMYLSMEGASASSIISSNLKGSGRATL